MTLQTQHCACLVIQIIADILYETSPARQSIFIGGWTIWQIKGWRIAASAKRESGRMSERVIDWDPYLNLHFRGKGGRLIIYTIGKETRLISQTGCTLFSNDTSSKVVKLRNELRFTQICYVADKSCEWRNSSNNFTKSKEATSQNKEHEIRVPAARWLQLSQGASCCLPSIVPRVW